MEHAVYVRPRPSRCRALFIRNVGVHHHQLRACFFPHHFRSFVMISMCMADQEDLRIAVFEPELLDTPLHRRQVLFVIRVDHNIPLRRVDQIDGQIRRPHPIEIAGNLERRKLAMHVGIALREQRARARQK